MVSSLLPFLRDRPRSCSLVRNQVSPSSISRIIKFYRDILSGLLYSHPGHDITNYLRSKVIAKKLSKMPPLTVSGEIRRERFKKGSRKFTHLSMTIGLTTSLDMTSLPAPYREYREKCVKRVRPTKESNNSATI